jgi:hypothetical protein
MEYWSILDIEYEYRLPPLERFEVPPYPDNFWGSGPGYGHGFSGDYNHHSHWGFSGEAYAGDMPPEYSALPYNEWWQQLVVPVSSGGASETPGLSDADALQLMRDFYGPYRELYNEMNSLGGPHNGYPSTADIINGMGVTEEYFNSTYDYNPATGDFSVRDVKPYVNNVVMVPLPSSSAVTDVQVWVYDLVNKGWEAITGRTSSNTTTTNPGIPADLIVSMNNANAIPYGPLGKFNRGYTGMYIW